MGVQGAGKGVQAQFIQQTYSIPQVSTGDLFRAMKTRNDPLAHRVQEIMSSGALVDDDTTNEVLKERLEKPDAANGVIFDGYPRNKAQAAWLEQYLASRSAAVSAVLLLKLDLYVAFKRTFGRLTSESGESYNIFYNNEGIDYKFVDHPEKAFPPRLEGTGKASGKPLIRRPDDANAAAIIKRIDLFTETTQPLIEYYRREGLLFEIDASMIIEAVSAAIRATIDKAQK
jgi:adenylate kinase